MQSFSTLARLILCKMILCERGTVLCIVTCLVAPLPICDNKKKISLDIAKHPWLRTAAPPLAFWLSFKTHPICPF